MFRTFRMWRMLRAARRSGLLMPGVYEPQSIMQIVAQLARRVQALSAQQQLTFSNAQGVPIMTTGAIVNASGDVSYGIQWMDPTTHQPVGFFGESSSGSFGLHFYNANGDLQALLNGDGMSVYNPSTGTVEVQAGLLNMSPAIYGLGVLPYGASVLQQSVGILAGSIVTADNVTNTSYADFSPSGAVTAEIGPSGQAMVSIGGTIGTGTAGQEGIVATSIDGNTPSVPYIAIASGAGGMSSSLSGSVLEIDITPGLHTFTPQYVTANNDGSTCSFTGIQLMVQPL